MEKNKEELMILPKSGYIAADILSWYLGIKKGSLVVRLKKSCPNAVKYIGRAYLIDLDSFSEHLSSIKYAPSLSRANSKGVDALKRWRASKTKKEEKRETDTELGEQES